MMRKIKNFYHLLTAVLSVIRYGNPSRKLKVIGVTGTDGKTTTSSLLFHILTNAGKKASMITTVYGKVGDQVFDTGLHVTSPPASLIQRLLKKSVQAGDEYFVLEVTSHAIDQYRDWGVRYHSGVITNITHEHLDYHKTYDNYVNTKTKLLLRAKQRYVNRDDRSFKWVEPILKKHEKKFFTYALKQNADYHMDIAKKIGRDLPTFNRYNYLAAYAVCRGLGIPEKDIFSAMKTFKNPVGRMEMVYNKEFSVIVDFAHTPNAVKEALEAVQQMKKKGGRIIHVFGSAGLRDQAKRPLMGKMSASHADIAVITEEDYRTEDPQKIAQEIASGMKKKGYKEVRFDSQTVPVKSYMINTVRGEAVKKALSLARKGDTVILTGKGHEKSLCRGKTEYPWSDQDEVRQILQTAKNNTK